MNSSTEGTPDTGGWRGALVLASSSPYRRELLARLGVAFEWEAPAIDESPMPGAGPGEHVRRLALDKARAVAERRQEIRLGSLIVGADQVAEIEGSIVGKPGSVERNVEQLCRAAGRVVTFHCAVAVLDRARGRHACESVEVRAHFRDLSRQEIERYVAREAPFDCAGGFKVEGLGIGLLEAVESSDPTALIGLPLIRLSAMLRDAGVPVP